MRIGIDLDDTIYCTKEQYKKYQWKYLKENKITEYELWNVKEYRVDYIKNNLELIFSDVKIKKDAKKVLKKLIDAGNEVFILTARSLEYRNDMYEFTKQSLKKNNVPYTKLILTDKIKLTACIDNKIDLMIDNSIDIYNSLNNKVNTLLFDQGNKYLDIDKRVISWRQIGKMLLGGK